MGMRNAFFIWLLLPLILVGCSDSSLELNFGDSQTISGKLAGYGSGTLSVSSAGISNLSCSAPQASIYKIASNGEREANALSTVALGSDGSYSFAIKSLGLKFKKSNPQDALVVMVSGCTSGVYARPITGAKDQDISVGSTLVS